MSAVEGKADITTPAWATSAFDPERKFHPNLLKGCAKCLEFGVASRTQRFDEKLPG